MRHWVLHEEQAADDRARRTGRADVLCHPRRIGALPEVPQLLRALRVQLAVAVEDGDEYCRSSRLTVIVPDLSDDANKAAWIEVERAKRRLLYTLNALRLPVVSKAATRRPASPSGSCMTRPRTGDDGA